MALSTSLLDVHSHDGTGCPAHQSGDCGWFSNPGSKDCNSRKPSLLALLAGCDIHLVHLPGVLKLTGKLWQLWLLIIVLIAGSHVKGGAYVAGNPSMGVHIQHIFDVYQVASVDELALKANEDRLGIHKLVQQGQLSRLEGEIVREVCFSYGARNYEVLWKPKELGLQKYLSERFRVHFGKYLNPAEVFSRDFLYHAVGQGRDLAKQDGMITVTDKDPEELQAQLKYHLDGPFGFKKNISSLVGQYYRNLDNPAWSPEFLRLTPSQRADWIVTNTNYSYSLARGLHFDGVPEYLVTPVQGLTLTEMPWNRSALRGTFRTRSNVSAVVIQKILRSLDENHSLADVIQCASGLQTQQVQSSLPAWGVANVECVELRFARQECALLLKFVCTLRLSRTLAPHNDLESGSRTGSDFDGSFESGTGDRIPSSFRRLASVNEFEEPHFTEELFLVNGSSVEPNLVVVGGEVDFLNGDGDHGPSSWPVTEDNSLGDQERRLSSGYGDDWDDDSSLSSWSVIEDDYPNLQPPTVTERMRFNEA